jgi:Phage integrase, N-terminal SAM-like domain
LELGDGSQASLFHGKQHPRELGTAEVEQVLTHLAVRGRVSASMQNQAPNAVVFLYHEVLEIDLGRFQAVRAGRPKRLSAAMPTSGIMSRPLLDSCNPVEPVV